MRISDWSSDVCSSDLPRRYRIRHGQALFLLCQHERRQVDDAAPGGFQLSRARYGDDAVDRVARRSLWSGTGDRKSVVEGERVSVRVDLGGRRILKKKKKQKMNSAKRRQSGTGQ